MNVDVIIPTYNPSNYLNEAIDSCLAQSYKGIKITVIDDCSKSGLDNFIKKYPMVNFLRLEKNSGPAAARNFGIKNTSSEFISFLDDDDVMHQDKIYYSIEEFKKNNSLGMTCGNYQVLSNGLLNKPFYSRDIEISHQALMRINFVASGSVTVKRNAINDVGLFNEKYWIAEDYDLWIRISERYPIKYIHKILYYYRVNNGSNSLFQRSDIKDKHDKNIEEMKIASKIRMGIIKI